MSSEYSHWADEAIERQIRTYDNDIDKFSFEEREIKRQIQMRLDSIVDLKDELHRREDGYCGCAICE